MRLLPLGGYDVVLGVQWMETLRPLLLDFTKMYTSFMREGKQTTLFNDNSKTNNNQLDLIQTYAQSLMYTINANNCSGPIPQVIEAILEVQKGFSGA